MRVSKWLGTTAVLGAGLAAFLGNATPAAAAEWVGGHYGPGGRWIPGHWIHGDGGPPPEAIEAPPGYREGRFWIAGHYGPGGHWIPGHWR